MSQYRAIYLDQKLNFKTYETIELRFVLINENTNTIITDFTGYTIKFHIENESDEVNLDNDENGGVTTSGGIITVTISESETEDFDEESFYHIELQVVKSSKKYTVYESDKFYIGKEYIDW